MNNRAIILASLILVFAIGTNFLTEQADDDQASAPLLQNEPDMYMLNAVVTQFDDDGKLQHKISADRFTHFPLTDMTSLKLPNMKLFPGSNVAPWDIQAKNGRLLPSSDYRAEVLELWDDVRAVRQDADGNFTRINTNSLTVFPEKEYAETNRKVSIDSNTARTTAAGMKAFFESGKFNFYSSPTTRVHTVFLAKQDASVQGHTMSNEDSL